MASNRRGPRRSTLIASNALRHQPSADNDAIRLETNFIEAELLGSTITANALLLLRRAAETGEQKLTATGSLSPDIANHGATGAIFVLKAHNPRYEAGVFPGPWVHSAGPLQAKPHGMSDASASFT